MSDININWTTFKSFINNKNLLLQYVDGTNVYYLFAFDEQFSISCVLAQDGGTDVVDFETNYKPTANKRLREQSQFGSGTLTDRSGTAGATSSQIMAANSNRKYLFIQNEGNQSIWINFTIPAVASQPSIQIIAGANFLMENNFISTEAVNIIKGGGSNQPFTAKEG